MEPGTKMKMWERHNMGHRHSRSKTGGKYEMVEDLFEFPREYFFWRVVFDCPEYQISHDGINAPGWEGSFEDIKDIVCKHGEVPYLVWVSTENEDGVFHECQWLQERGYEVRLAKCVVSEVVDKTGTLEDCSGWFMAFYTKEELVQFKLIGSLNVELISERK